MDTDPVTTAMAFHQCGVADWGRMTVRDGFMSYDFGTGEFLGLEAETIRANKRVRRSDEATMSFTLLAMPLSFFSRVSRTALEAVPLNYDKDRGLADNPDENEVQEYAEGVNLEALLEEDLLWCQVVDAGDVTEKALEAVRSLVTAVRHNVLISKKRYFVLVHFLVDKVQKAKRESDATIRHRFEKEGTFWELELKNRLLTNDSVAVVGFKKTSGCLGRVNRRFEGVPYERK